MANQKSIPEKLDALTPHQRRIIQLAMQEKSTKEIARLIGSSEYAVRKDFHEIYNALDLKNRTRVGLIIFLFNNSYEWHCNNDDKSIVLPVNKIINLQDLNPKVFENDNVYFKVELFNSF